MEAEWKALEAEQGEDGLSTFSRNLPHITHPFPTVPSRQSELAFSLGIPKTLVRLHWDAGSMAAAGRDTHVAGVEREAQAELLSTAGGLWPPVSYSFEVKALLMLSAEVRNQHPVLFSSNAPKAGRIMNGWSPSMNCRQHPLPNAA